MVAIESHGVFVTHSGTTEDIQRRTDGEINFALAHARHGLKIRQRFGASGVSDGNR
jgi:hypothetical protein